MSKEKKIKDMLPEVPEKMSIEGEEIELKTGKKYLKQADKLVRQMDKALNDLHKVTVDVTGFRDEMFNTQISPKDQTRFDEMVGVLTSTTDILYHLTARMARKYVGKEIDDLGDTKRKSLKR